MKSNYLLRVVDIILFVCAAVLIGRAIPQRNLPAFDLVVYAHGGIKMPFQARYMMVPFLRTVHESGAWTKATHVLSNSAQSPEQLAIQFADVLGILLAGISVSALRRRLAPWSVVGWLAKWVLLWIVAITYVARYEQALYLPYDLPSLGLFSLGLVCAAYGLAVPFVLVVVLAAFNRETALFLVPIWAMLQIYDKPKRVSAMTAPFAALIGCFVVKTAINHWLKVSGSGLEFIIGPNLKTLLPHHLPQVLSVGGYLLLPILVLWRHIPSVALKRIWIGFLPFAVGALTVGLWNETRIFGEMSTTFALTGSLLLEHHVRQSLTMRTLKPQVENYIQTNEHQDAVAVHA